MSKNTQHFDLTPNKIIKKRIFPIMIETYLNLGIETTTGLADTLNEQRFGFCCQQTESLFAYNVSTTEQNTKNNAK